MARSSTTKAVRDFTAICTLSWAAMQTGVSPQTMHFWCQRYEDFPAPIEYSHVSANHHHPKNKRNRLYYWPDIEAFLERNELPVYPKERRYRRKGGQRG